MQQDGLAHVHATTVIRAVSYIQDLQSERQFFMDNNVERRNNR